MDPQLRTEIDRKLGNFADAIGPCKNHWKEGKIAVQRIVDCLKQDTTYHSVFKLVGSAPVYQSTYQIGWMLYNGSVGKRTALKGSDFDVLVFINGHRPPMIDCLLHFRNILQRKRFLLQIENVTCSPHAIQFKITSCNIKVDLIPAANFLEKNPIGLRQRDRIVEQHRRALEAMERQKLKPEAAVSIYGTSLVAYQREFIRDLGDLNAKAVRLGKYWFKSLEIGKPPSDAKTMLELIMAASFLQETNESLLSIFNRFLSTVISLESDSSVKIKFIVNNRSRESERKWSLETPNNKTPQGYIIDPSNPFNDYLKGVRKERRYLANLAQAARVTMARLRGVISPENVLDIMFQPQYLPHGRFPSRTGGICNTVMGYQMPYTSRHSDATHQTNNHFLQLPEHSLPTSYKLRRGLRNISVTPANPIAFSRGNPQKDSEGMMNATYNRSQKLVASDVLERNVNWRRHLRPYGNYDVVAQTDHAMPMPSGSTSHQTSNSLNVGANKFGFSCTKSSSNVFK